MWPSATYASEGGPRPSGDAREEGAWVGNWGSELFYESGGVSLNGVTGRVSFGGKWERDG